LNYNILHGFYSEKHKLEEKRLKAAQEVVRLEDPDILVLTEACYGIGDKRDYDIKMDYGKLFSFPNYTYARRGDYEWGSAILSKYSIIHTKNNERGMRQHVRSIIDLNGKDLMVDIAHPHPDLSEEEKLTYFKELVLPGHKALYILAGDFNAISDQDNYNREKLISGLTGHEKNPEKLVDSMLKTLVAPYIRSLGLVDTYKAVNPNKFSYTIPTDLLSKNKDSAMRMDFIFCSPDIKVKDAYVIKNSKTEVGSDHYPIVAVLEFPDK